LNNVTSQEFIKFWGKFFAFVLLVLIEISHEFKTFWVYSKTLLENYFKLFCSLYLKPPTFVCFLFSCSVTRSYLVSPFLIIPAAVSPPLWRVSQQRKQNFSYDDEQEQAKIWSTRCKTTSERD
jgi:hypothetical protein